MKSNHLFRFFTTGILTAGILTGLCLSVSAEENTPTDDTVMLQTLLEDSGFTVQEGTFYELDTIKEASEGRLMSCFGNNAGSAYTIFSLPEAPEQTVPNLTFPPDGWQYKLCQDEAIVLITSLPPFQIFINF